MKPCAKGHQRSRLRVDPITLTQLLCEQNTTLSAIQQRTGFDPAELEALRTAHKIHLETLNRLAAGLKVPPNSLLIAPDSPFSSLCSKSDSIVYITRPQPIDPDDTDIDGGWYDVDEWDENDPPEDNPLYL